MKKIVKIAIAGFGSVTKQLLSLLTGERERLWHDYGIAFLIVGVADSQGAACSAQGLPAAKLAVIKQDTGSVAFYPEFGVKGMTALEMIELCSADLIVECTPAHLPSGEPGLTHIRQALALRKQVVTANKAPLVLAWEELMAAAGHYGVQIRYGAAASAALPVLQMGEFLGRNGELLEMSGIFNATSQFVLEKMAEGTERDSAIAEAKQRGFAEADPTNDIEGYDTAMKTIILANTFWGSALGFADLTLQGISGLTRQDLQTAAAAGETWRLIGRARWQDGKAQLRVGPERIALSHPLAAVKWHDKGLYLKTRNLGEQMHYSFGAAASGTAATVLLDMVSIAQTLR
ncbi:MAG: hypothetical protein LLG09_07250 [Negativicutes bacterium]|nr:hypothetical protein [Negativicutes bacterium]